MQRLTAFSHQPEYIPAGWPHHNRSLLQTGIWMIPLAFIALGLTPFRPTPPSSVEAIVSKIRSADYRGDRRALERQCEELQPFLSQTEATSRVHYWRGFAVWRDAINGFNDAVDPKVLADELTRAVREFNEALAIDAGFADAKIAEASCL